MKFTLTVLLTLLSFVVSAQKINYLNEHFTKINFKEKATYYTETTKTGPSSGIVKTFFMNGQLVSEESFSNLRYQRRDGLTRNYYNDGKVKSEIAFKNGVFHGPLKTYYPSQRLKRAELYEDGNFVTGKCFTPAGIDTTFFAFQTEPHFPGGKEAVVQYLINNSRVAITPIDYMLIKRGFNKYVLVKFVVTAEGDITDVMISRSLSEYYDREANVMISRSLSEPYDREALRLVSNMPKWNPGLQDGEKATIEYTLPIGFK
ncbi:energy transducer TonB [Adhaeribacter terreus]|uniref:Energy transducer TonB n=1 Tax=Adhaeribacter terreus TaxID=529703 RepID=A0ABW0ED59_9BACT